MLGRLSTNLPNEWLDPPSTAVDLIKGDFANDLWAVASVGNTVLAILYEILLEETRTNFLSFWIFSISPGSFSAKVSFSVAVFEEE